MKLADLLPDQLRHLATLAGTTPDYLRHLTKGRRQSSADMAARIETASIKLKLETPIGRETLCEACRKCKYRKACAAAAKE